MLNQGTSFKRVAESLRISDPRQLKRMMTKELGYKFRVYHRFTTQEMSTTIQGALPISEHGANWGIRHVKAALSRLHIRAPRRSVARALEVISGAFNFSLNFMNSNTLHWLYNFKYLILTNGRGSLQYEKYHFAEAHYNRRRRALPIVRRQYNVTIPMALWHIDCKLICFF